MTAIVKIKTAYQTYDFTLYNIKDLSELHKVIFDRLWTLTKEELKHYVVHMEVTNK